MTGAMEHWSTNRRVFLATTGAPVGWLLVFFAAPLFLVWLYTFAEVSGLADVAITGTFANYARLGDPVYLTVFLKSVWIALLVTVVCLVVGFPMAMLIAFARPRTATLLLMAVMLPFWTNLLIRTYALMALLRNEGVINGMLGWVGLGPWQMLYSNFAVVVGLVYVHLPFVVLPVYASLARLDRSLIEASLDLGAGHLRTIREVIIPLAWPGIVSAAVITFIPALGSYLTSDLLGGTDSMMIANLIERQFKRANDWPFGATLSFVLVYLTLLVIMGQALLQRRSEGAGR